MNFSAANKYFKTQPIKGWWNPGGTAKGRPRQYGRNCSNLHVIQANKCLTEPSVSAVNNTDSVVNTMPVNSPESNSTCLNETEKLESIPKDNDFDEVSDSSLVDDEKSSEKWENISDDSFEEMYEVDTIDVSCSSTASRELEFSVGYRSCTRKYLKHYKRVNFFKPKIYSLSKNRCLVNCLNINEKPKEESESEEIICMEVEDLDSAHEVIDQDSGSVKSDVLDESNDVTVSKESDEGTANEDPNKDIEKDAEDGVTIEDEVIVCQNDVTSDDAPAPMEENEIRFCQGKVEIQDEIDKAEDPLLGLEYIVEVWDDAKSAVLNYSCWICDKIQMQKQVVLDHVKSVSHRIAYLTVHFPSGSAKFTQHDALNDDLQKQLELLCQEISNGCQKCLSFVATQGNLDKHGSELMELMSAATHCEGNGGRSVSTKGDSDSHSSSQKSEICNRISVPKETTELIDIVSSGDSSECPTSKGSTVADTLSEVQCSKGLETTAEANKPATFENPSNLSVICSSERSLLKYRRMRNNRASCNIPLKNEANKTLSELSTNKSSSNIPILSSDNVESDNVVMAEVIGGDRDTSTRIKAKKRHVHRKPHRPFCRKNHSGKPTQNIILHSPVLEKQEVSEIVTEGVTKNLKSKETSIAHTRRQHFYRSIRPSVYTWVKDMSNDSKSKNTSNAITIDKSEGGLACEDASQSGKKAVSGASEKTGTKLKESAINVALSTRTKKHSKSSNKKWADVKASSGSTVQNQSKLTERSVEDNRSSNSRREVSKLLKMRNDSPAKRLSASPLTQKRSIGDHVIKKKSKSPINAQSSRSITSVRKSHQHSRSPLRIVKRHLHSPLRKPRERSTSPVRRLRQNVQRSKNESESNDVRRSVQSIRNRISPISRVSPVGRHVRGARRSRSISRERFYSFNDRKSASPSRVYRAYSRSPIRPLRRRSRSRSRSPRRRSRSVSKSPRRLSRDRARPSRRHSRSSSSSSPPLRRHRDNRSRSRRRHARNSPYTARQRSRTPRLRRRSRSPLVQSLKSRRSRSHSIHRRSSRSLSSEIDSLLGKRSARSSTRNTIERGKLVHSFENIRDNERRSSERRIARKDKEFENDAVSRSEFLSMFHASYPLQSSQSLQYAFPNPSVSLPYSAPPGNVLPVSSGAPISHGGVNMGNMQFSSPVAPVQAPVTSGWMPGMSSSGVSQNIHQPYTKPEFKATGSVQSNVPPLGHAKKPSHISSFDNERLFQDMRSAVNKLFGTSVAGEKFSHDLSRSRSNDSNSNIQTLIPGINDHDSSHGMSSQSNLMNIDTETLLEKTLNHIKSNLNAPFLDRNEILRSAVLELLPKELLKQFAQSSKFSSPEASQAHNIRGQFGQNVSESVNVHPPPLPTDAKVQFKEGSKISNPVNIFPIVNQSIHSSSVDKHINPNTSRADSSGPFRGSYETSDNSHKLSLAHRLASVLVKLGMIDVPSAFLSEMLRTIVAFDPSMPLQDISESHIVTILHKCGYLHTK